MKDLKILIKDKYLLFIVLATLIQISGMLTGLINWGQIPKYIFSMLLWLSVLTFPYKKLSIKGYYCIDRILIYILIFLTIYSIIRVPFESSDLYENPMYGNKYISWIFNELSMLLFYPLLFIALGSSIVTYLKIRIGVLICIFATILFSIYSPHISPSMLIMIPFLYPLYYKKYKKIFYLALFLLIIKGLGFIGLARISTLFMLSVFSSFIFIKVNRVTKIIMKLYCIIMICLPIYFIYSSLQNDKSIFSEFSSFSLNRINSEDTRTFLYKEVTNDLIKNQAVLLGKGSHSFYYSSYFDNAMDIRYRNAVEVPFLNFWLKAGLLFCITLVMILIRAVYLSVWKSNNIYIQIVGCYIANIYFILFIGDINGTSILQCLLWLLVGSCLSPQIRLMHDVTIKNIISNNSILYKITT